MKYEIRGEPDHLGSISSSLGSEYRIRPGIHRVALSEFEAPSFAQNFYSVSDRKRVDDLKQKIRSSGWVSPLIVVYDQEGAYVLEGAHRLVALHELGSKDLPALVVDDTSARKNPPSTALVGIGRLVSLEVLKDGKVSMLRPSGRQLAWDPAARAFHIVTPVRKVRKALPPKVARAHQAFHQAPSTHAWTVRAPSPQGALRDLGLVKALTYFVPPAIKSPEKNRYLWHHAFGDTGHKGGKYPTKVMPALLKDARGNLFIRRRRGNIFTVDSWLRG